MKTKFNLRMELDNVLIYESVEAGRLLNLTYLLVPMKKFKDDIENEFDVWHGAQFERPNVFISDYEFLFWDRNDIAVVLSNDGLVWHLASPNHSQLKPKGTILFGQYMREEYPQLPLTNILKKDN